MKWKSLALVVTVFLCSCSNKVEEAKKLIAENKKEEAISILSQVETSNKQYSEAQKLIKQTKSDILYSKGYESFKNYKYEEALKYFEQVEDEENSFPILKKYKEEAKACIELFKNLPGTYEGSNTPNLGGAYMIINTKMKIDDDLVYTIKEQMTDTYSGGFYNDLYAGKVKPRVTRFNSGDYGFILDLNPYTSAYRKNDFSVYFYKYKNYWRLQFNLTYGSTQQYTLNLFREDSEEEKTSDNGYQNSETSTDNDEISYFISAFINFAKNKDINSILNCYADEVDYFGKGQVDKDFILKDKENYYKSLDNIDYWLIENSVNLTDLSDNSKLAVFKIGYSVFSNKSNKQLDGIAESTCKIRKRGYSWEIYDEKQKIISKKL